MKVRTTQKHASAPVNVPHDEFVKLGEQFKNIAKLARKQGNTNTAKAALRWEEKIEQTLKEPVAA